MVQLGPDFEQSILEQIENVDGRNHATFGLKDQTILFEKTKDLEGYLGCSRAAVPDLSRLSSAEVVGMQEVPQWLCMRVRSLEPFQREVLCSGFVVNRWTNDELESEVIPQFPIFLKKDESEKRYVFVQASDLACMVSLLADLLGDLEPFYRRGKIVYTSDPNLLDQIRDRDWMLSPIMGECNFLPLCCVSDFEGELYDEFVDLNDQQLPPSAQLQAPITLLYNQITPAVVDAFAKYKKEIEDEDKFANHFCYILRRLGGLTPNSLRNGIRVNSPKYASFLNHWEKLGKPSCREKSGYTSGPDNHLVTSGGTGLTDLILAAMNFAVANPEQEVEEISLQVMYTDTDTELLYTNLLGSYGFIPLFAPEMMSKLIAPEQKMSLLAFPFNKEVEIRVFLFHASGQPLSESEAFRRFMAYVVVFVSNYLGSLADKNLIKMCYSQIQARNFSHNIGSHALVKFRNDLEVSNSKIKKILKEAANNGIASELIDVCATMENLRVGQEYIAEKARYLASFALADTNFVWHRTTASRLHSQLKDYNYVFNSLADWEEFTVKFEFLLNGEPVSFTNDIELSMPEAGEFALFNIVENVVRNAVKHENTGTTDCQTLVLALEESPKDIVLQIYCAGSLYDEKICDQLNGYIQESVVDPYSTQLNIHNLGVKEMRAAVLYLNGRLPGSEEYEQQLPTSNKRNDAPLLEACRMTDAKGKPLKEWGYRFRLTKSNRLLLVTGDEEKGLPSGWGVDCVKIDALEHDLKARQSVCSHDFLIYSTALSDDVRIQEFAKNNLLPIRKITMDLQQFVNREEIVNRKEIYREVWEAYARRHYLKGITVLDRRPSSFGLVDSSGTSKYPYSYNHTWGEEQDQYYYSDALSSRLQMNSPLYKNLNCSRALKEEEMSINKCSIACYTTLAVYILDERIQHLIFERNLLEQWKKMLIFIPDKIGGKFLDEMSIDEVKAYLDVICAHHPLDGYGFRVNKENVAVVFHESLLQRWLGSEHVRQFLSELQEKEYSVLLTSGRGRAQYLTDKTRFVPFNSLLNRVEEGDKYGLYELLMNART